MGGRGLGQPTHNWRQTLALAQALKKECHLSNRSTLSLNSGLRRRQPWRKQGGGQGNKVVVVTTDLLHGHGHNPRNPRSPPLAHGQETHNYKERMAHNISYSERWVQVVPRRGSAPAAAAAALASRPAPGLPGLSVLDLE